ncbi:MAG: hypothetical protein NTV06_01860, partial [candidate division Zixibacteria bacterium]|nr:hypothetical protein [candidate division Zixibacteria bacterium]
MTRYFPHRQCYGLVVFALLAIFFLGGNAGGSQLKEDASLLEGGAHDSPKETGLLGNSDMSEKYNAVSSEGDLNVHIPILDIPGAIPISLSLDYNSGIKIDQSATWVGLGWNLANWSIRRITVHGDDPNSFNQNTPNTREDVNDMYIVNVPGRTLKFINIGTMKWPVYVPLTYSNDSLYSENHIHDALWDYWDHNYFIMTNSDGTRYIFAQALKMESQQGPGAIWNPYDNVWT